MSFAGMVKIERQGSLSRFLSPRPSDLAKEQTCHYWLGKISVLRDEMSGRFDNPVGPAGQVPILGTRVFGVSAFQCRNFPATGFGTEVPKHRARVPR